jgi:hypothetical protein
MSSVVRLNILPQSPRLRIWVSRYDVSDLETHTKPRKLDFSVPPDPAAVARACIWNGERFIKYCLYPC